MKVKLSEGAFIPKRAYKEDSVEICVLRKCKYAIAELIDCYEPKQPERMTNR